MAKFDISGFEKEFGNLDDVDSKYPSAYIPKLVKKLIAFMRWIVFYIENEINRINSRMTAFDSTINKQKQSIADAKKREEVSNKKMKQMENKIDELNESINELDNNG